MKTHTFDGQELTTAQIRAIVPCFRPDAILKHLKAGRNTKDAMLNYVPPKAKPGAASQFVIGKPPGFARACNSNMR